MNKIILKATANRLEIEKDTYTTGGSVNYDSCSFDFDNTWNGFIKTAVFGFGNSDYTRVDLEDNECKIPAICLQDEGFIKIGVYGVNSDGVVITTNAVAHRVNEGVGEVNDWCEEDNLFVYNALKEIEGAIEKYKGGLETRFNDLLKNLRNKGSISDIDVLPGEPDDWYTPSEFQKSSAFPTATGAAKYNTYLKAIFGTLTTEFPEYVSVEETGTDESGTFPIYAYTFEPINYEKTVLVTGCIHSNNDVTVRALSHFFDELCRNFKNDRTLSYLRSKVKFVVVPVANPYGFVNKSKRNVNGVDIGKNFPYKWDECYDVNKGDGPLSEKESAALLGLLTRIYEDKLCAALDVNSGLFNYCSKMLFYPRYKDNCLSALTETLSRYNYENRDDDVIGKAILAPTVNPSLTNYLAETLGVNACSISWSPYACLGDEVTKFAEFIGNVLYTLSKNSTYTLTKENLPFVKHFSWRSSGNDDTYKIIASDTCRKVPISAFQFDVANPCCMSLTGYVVLKLTNNCNVTVNPVLWQEDSPEQTYEKRAETDAFSLDLMLGEGIHVIPVESVLQAFASDTNTQVVTVYPKKVRFALAAKSDIGSSAEIIGCSFTLTAFRSDSGKAVEISRPMGNATDFTNQHEVPTQEVLYPKEIITENDARYDD